MSAPEGHAESVPFTYEISPHETPSTAVVAAVATVTGYRPVASGHADGDDAPVLDPLYSVVDPDVLNAVFRDGRGSTASSAEVRFRYHDCEVTVLGGVAGREPSDGRSSAGDGVVKVVPLGSVTE